MELSQDVSMAVPSRMIVNRRATITALPLYFSGKMQKKYTGEGGFKLYHGELRGSTMFFYTNDKQETYSERLELHNLRSMEPGSCYSNCSAPVYTLTFPNQEVQLKMDNPDIGEQWRGYILTVAKLEVPRQLQLLPGQFMRLQEVQDQEQQRRVQQTTQLSAADVPASCSGIQSTSVAMDEYDDTLSFPNCYMSVSREEARELLQQNPECGSIILRPATDKRNFSITTRQIFPSGPVLKNYKVLASEAGYIIQFDEPVTVPTLNDVVDHFVEQTANQLKPFINLKPYDTRIVLPPPPVAPKPKAVPRARVAPTIHTQPPPPTRPPPTLLEQTSEYEKDDIRKTPDDKKKKTFKPASKH